MSYKAWKITGVIATAVISLVILLMLRPSLNPVRTENTKPVFTGGHTCVECHQKEFNLWKGSDHDSAMTVASDLSVAGDFNNAEFTFNGVTSKFYKKNGKFYVFTEGINGKMTEFEVAYTFGIRPLQQYLIPFEDGKYQCLPIAWNTNTHKWFHMAAMIYKPDDLKPTNWLYWTNQAQNWNSMCAECHSTNLKKNFDLQNKSYKTTWVDINVNCEACHGPGSSHIEWARLPELQRPKNVNARLVVKTSKITSQQYVETCAPCHSRRSSLGVYDHSQNNFLNFAIPQLPTTPVYHVDGQFLDENYEYGSFLQSKMYMKGVRCGDCHDPHSLKRKYEGNALCTQCHKAADYDTYNHHRHKLNGESGTAFKNKLGEKIDVGSGAICRDCHMPGRYYMGVDKRHDHSIRIPRPDLSVALGTPNACTNCHDDKSAKWALQWVNNWYGVFKKEHYGTALARATAFETGADSGLLRIIKSNLYPDIIRATAIGLISSYQNTKVQELLQSKLNDTNSLIRLSAVKYFMAADSFSLFNSLVLMLNDPVKSVRIETAKRMLLYPKKVYTNTQYSSFLKATEEYRLSQEFVADFPAGRYNLGNYYARLNNVSQAEEHYKEAIAIDNLFHPAKTNLALLWYSEGKTKQAVELFNEIIKSHPELMDGYYYLALIYSEQQKYQDAIKLLETAISKPSCNARIYYNLGVLYQMTGQNKKCEFTFNKGLDVEPGNMDLLYALYSYYLKQNNIAKANASLEKLKLLYPDNRQFQQM